MKNKILLPLDIYHKIFEYCFTIENIILNDDKKIFKLIMMKKYLN